MRLKTLAFGPRLDDFPLSLLCLVAAVYAQKSTTISGIDSSSCGRDSIPYLLNVDSQGKPELFCDTPACFGEGLGIRDDEKKLGGMEELDSALRKAIDDHPPSQGSTGPTPSPFTAMKKRFIREARSNYAECTGKLSDAICSGPDEWTGGVAEVNNGTHIFMQMECCTYPGLLQSAELKTVVLKPGQKFVGGDVLEEGKLIAFDLVKEIRKNVSASNEVSYLINIYRMLCSEELGGKGGSLAFTSVVTEEMSSPIQPISHMPNKPKQKTKSYDPRITDAVEEELMRRVNQRGRMRAGYGLPRRGYEDYSDGEDPEPPPRPIGRRRPDNYEAAVMQRILRRKQASSQASGVSGRHSKHPTLSRRRLYRPVPIGDDEYEDYYDMGVPALPLGYPRRSHHYRGSRLRFAEDRLWPTLAYSVGRGGKPRLYADGAYEPENQVPIKTDDTTANAAVSPPTESTQQVIASSSALGEQLQRDLGSPPGISVPSNYITLVPPIVHPPSPPMTLQGYPTVNSYVSPPSLSLLPAPIVPVVGYPTAVSSQSSSYESSYQQQQPTYQQTPDCSCPSSYSTGGYAQQPCSQGYGLGSTSSSSSSSCCCSGSGYGSSSGANLNGMFSSLQCFSGDMEVETLEGRKAMRQLRVGDMVMSIDQSIVSYSTVVMFLHRKAEEAATFIQITTDGGRALKLTSHHLIYMTDCGIREKLRLVPAHKLRVGNCAHMASRGNDGHVLLHSTKITEIEEVEEAGIYAPLTTSGDIIVNGILASCHSNVAMQTLQQTFFDWWRNLSSLIFSTTPVGSNERVELDTSEKNASRRDESSKRVEHDLPFGVEHLITIMDFLLPVTEGAKDAIYR